MSEVDPRRVVIYYVSCKCGKYFASLKRFELMQNFVAHLKRHGKSPEPFSIMEKEVSLE